MNKFILGRMKCPNCGITRGTNLIPCLCGYDPMTGKVLEMPSIENEDISEAKPIKGDIIDFNLRDKMVNNIMADFNFEKVQKVMKFLGWKYYDSSCPPTIKELRETALECLNAVKYETEYKIYATGGFCARFETFSGGNITLSFEITERNISENDMVN